MKKRTILLCLAAFLCVAGLTVRIWMVNKDNEQLLSQAYPMGQAVAFEKDFFYRGDDIRDGYEIRVNSATVTPLPEYLASIEKNEDDLNPGTPISHVYDVEVTIRNNNMEEDEKKIDLINMQLNTINESYQVDMDLLTLLYPQIDNSSFGFRVLPGTETTVHLPYAVHEWHHLSAEQIKNKSTSLLLSMYPVKKTITVIPD